MNDKYMQWYVSAGMLLQAIKLFEMIVLIFDSFNEDLIGVDALC